jgi:putative flippase GtrA
MKPFLQKLRLFLRYSGSGLVAFLFELGLLYFFIEVLALHYLIAVSLAFAFAATAQYAVCHWWVFKKSRRSLRVEYEYFLGIRIAGVLLTLVLVALFVQVAGLNIYAARILSSLFTGLFGFYLNARFNFRAHPFLHQK